jgi:hypothetical protein
MVRAAETLQPNQTMFISGQLLKRINSMEILFCQRWHEFKPERSIPIADQLALPDFKFSRLQGTATSGRRYINFNQFHPGIQSIC